MEALSEEQKCRAQRRCALQAGLEQTAHSSRGHAFGQPAQGYCATHPIQMDTYMALSMTCRKAGEAAKARKGDETNNKVGLCNDPATACRITSSLTCATGTALPPYAEQMCCQWDAPRHGRNYW